MSAMVVTTRPTTLPAPAATDAAPTASWLALRACSAFCLTVEVSSSIEAAVSSRLAACCSVRRDRSLLPEAISVEAVEMADEAPWMRETIEVSWAAVALASSRMVANTPWKSPSMRVVRSPCDSAVNRRETSDRLTELASSSVFSCCASCSRKPCLPSVPTRSDRSPAAADATIRATSASTWISVVRSRHSQTVPTFSPSALRISEMLCANTASPYCISRWPRPSFSSRAMKAGSILPPCSSTDTGRPASGCVTSTPGSAAVSWSA